MLGYPCFYFSLFIASLIEPVAWILYSASVIVGFGASSMYHLQLMTHQISIFHIYCTCCIRTLHWQPRMIKKCTCFWNQNSWPGNSVVNWQTYISVQFNDHTVNFISIKTINVHSDSFQFGMGILFYHNFIKIKILLFFAHSVQYLQGMRCASLPRTLVFFQLP